MKASTRHRNAARFVGPFERILYLKSLPTMGEASVDQLASLAEYLEERTYRRGQVLLARDRPVEALHFVVSGRVRATFRDATIAIVEPPEGVGFTGALSRIGGGFEAIAELDTRTLSIPADAFFGIIEDNFSLMIGGIRQLSQQLLDARERLPDNERSGSSTTLEPKYPDAPMDLVERLVWTCRDESVFSDSNVDAVMQICQAQSEERWQPGERIYSEGDQPDFGFSIRYGLARCWGTAGKRPFTAGAGFAMGFLDGMAGVPRHLNVEAETEVVAIVDQIRSVVDVLEDNVDLAFDLSASLATMLLGISSRAGPV